MPAQPTAKLAFHPQPDPDDLLDNLSAVTFAGGHLWVAGDELNDGANTIERLTWDRDAKQFGGHVRFPVSSFLDLPDGPEEEIDLEGLAAGDGYLWMVGSHSNAMRKPKRNDDGAVTDHADAIDRLRFARNKPGPNRHLIARVPLHDGQLVKKIDGRTAAAVEFTDAGNLLTDALAGDPHIGPYVTTGVPSKANGLDVEGLEYAGGRLFLGLRGPVLLDYALVIEIEPKENGAKGELKLRKIGPNGERYRKHFLRLHGRGVRDLTWDGTDLLVLAGPTMNLDAPAAVYRLRDAASLPDAVLYEPEFERIFPFAGEGRDVPRGRDHAEGMTVADVGGKRRLVVLYDSPAGGRKDPAANTVTADLFDV